MLSVPGKFLSAPVIRYGSTGENIDFQPQEGTWRLFDPKTKETNAILSTRRRCPTVNACGHDA